MIEFKAVLEYRFSPITHDNIAWHGRMLFEIDSDMIKENRLSDVIKSIG